MNKQGKYRGYGRKVEDNFPTHDVDKEDEIFDWMYDAATTLTDAGHTYRNIIVIGITDDDDNPSIVASREYNQYDYLEGSIALTTRVHNELLDDEELDLMIDSDEIEELLNHYPKYPKHSNYSRED